MKICFASHNANKVKEMNEIMPEGISIVGLKDLGITSEIEETGDTLEENSNIKASYVFERHKMPVFADDSGLLVSALEGAPGVFSARYAGFERDDDKNMDLLLANLANKHDRSASFKTVITFIDESGNVSQFDGTVKGEIIHEKKGTNGFGYDPIFQPSGYIQTFAELSTDIKNRISHRAKAVQKLLEYLRQINE
ncbi:RdgB/HAM1 family non-canonical purine NTP pyrophosphatase [Ekhidna sp.]|uniref:RdgB/HAM1 family non-canonical purine NTP pyrophosphatase n=1 Tax=Ekhidna sp. TaxID=2608089 RepID=UPI0032EDE511